MAGNLQQFKKGLYQFSVVAVMNYHKLGGFKHHTFILLKLWRPEVQNESYPKIKGQKNWFLLQGRSVPCFSQLLGATSIPCLVTTLVRSLLCGHIAFSSSKSNFSLLPSHKHTCGSCVCEPQPGSHSLAQGRQSGNMNCFDSTKQITLFSFHQNTLVPKSPFKGIM